MTTILLIRPGLGAREAKRYSSLACLEPKALSLLAGLTPPEVKVVAVDDRFEAIPYDDPWDLVALSVGTFEARRAYHIARRFRARGVKVAMGGYHPTLCPDEAAQHADAVAVGEAEGLWPRMVEHTRRGALRRRYTHDSPPDLAGVLPRREIFSAKRYLPMNVVQFGRGCHHACDFCCIKAFYGRTIRHRPVKDVVNELRADGRRQVLFADDNLAADRGRLEELLHAITPLGLRWSGQLSMDQLQDPRLLDLMARSGCQCALVGLESLDGRNLSLMGKGWSPASRYADLLAAIRARGIMAYATFVFGYDSDGPGAPGRALDFALEQKLFMANFNHLQPFPGTRLYRRLEREGRLLHDRWWLDPGYRFGDVVFRPRGLTPGQLSAACHQARSEFHGARNIAKRLADPAANLANLPNALTFLAANLSSAQDIRRKQGVRLGEAGQRPSPAGSWSLLQRLMARRAS